jgi:hypothetical protein
VLRFIIAEGTALEKGETMRAFHDYGSFTLQDKGNGSVKGTAVNSGVALAGTDALAVDLVGAELMGFDPRTIGYL